MKNRFYLQNFEEAAKVREKELNNELILKYENLLFLENVPNEDKLELSKLY